MSLSTNAAGRRVAVFGAGPGGMTAAHELAERGFSVDLYERHDLLGGKCRSFSVPGTGTDGRADLPGELGPHVYFGTYRHAAQTWARIPISESRTVLDNLVIGKPGSRMLYCFSGDVLAFPHPSPRRWGEWLTPRTLLNLAKNLRRVAKRIPNRDMLLLASKSLAILTSGPNRQWGQLEYSSLTDFIGAEQLSELSRGMLDIAVQAHTPPASRMNARLFSTAGMRPIIVDYLLKANHPDLAEGMQINSGPSNEIWFDPWEEHLTKLGVRIHTGHRLSRFSVAGGRIAGATVVDPDGHETAVAADHYILAVPADKAASLMSQELIDIDPALGRISRIEETWLGAIQIYLTKSQPKLEYITVPMTSPWGVFAMNVTNKMWNRDFAREYGDGTVVTNISFDLADWNNKGILYGKTAKECTLQELYDEAIAQLRVDLGDDTVLAEEDVHSWCLNPAITKPDVGPLVNDEPLFGTPPGCWQNQPDAVTGVPNLFLASSYVRTTLGADGIDGANEAGKRAANGVLDAVGDNSSRVPVHDDDPPGLLRWLWKRDDRRYARGLPNVFDRVAPSRP